MKLMVRHATEDMLIKCTLATKVLLSVVNVLNCFNSCDFLLFLPLGLSNYNKYLANGVNNKDY